MQIDLFTWDTSVQCDLMQYALHSLSFVQRKTVSTYDTCNGPGTETRLGKRNPHILEFRRHGCSMSPI